MNIQLNTHEWLSLPMDVRQRLREIFGIQKSEGARVIDNKVESDGTTYADLSVITVEKMREYLELPECSNHEFPALYDLTIEKIKEELNPVVQEIPPVDSKQILVDEWVATLTRVKGQAVAASMEDYLDNVLKRVFEIKPTIITQTNEKQKKKPGRPKKAK